MLQTISRGKDIIRQEAETLLALEKLLDNNFEKAVKLISQCKGKVVISGIGKAGLIGKKIAATLSSIGTSSFFMHPADAAHGDMGMVSKEDVIILLSNSGESIEVTSLIPTIKTIGPLLIAITGRPDSELGRNCDILLNLGDIKEACPFGLAPTCSTTAILALGDALAVCAMEMKPNFTEMSYAINHPGGALGKKLLRVEQVMKKNPHNVIATPNQIIKDILFEITSKRTGVAIIVNMKEELVGVFSDGDLRRAIEKEGNVLDKPVEKYMTSQPKSVSSICYAREGLQILKECRIGDLPVLDENNKVCGVLSLKDLVDIGLI